VPAAVEENIRTRAGVAAVKRHLCSHPVDVILVASLESFDFAQRFSDSCCQNLLDSQKSVKTRPISGKMTATLREKKSSLTQNCPPEFKPISMAHGSFGAVASSPCAQDRK